MSEQQTIVHSRAAVETKQAARYLTQLCKHFQHKRPVTLASEAGASLLLSATAAWTHRTRF